MEKEYSRLPKLDNISEGIRLIFEKEKEIERIDVELKKLEEELFSTEEKLRDKKKEVFIHLEKLEVKTLEDIKIYNDKNYKSNGIITKNVKEATEVYDFLKIRLKLEQ